MVVCMAFVGARVAVGHRGRRSISTHRLPDLIPTAIRHQAIDSPPLCMHCRVRAEIGAEVALWCSANRVLSCGYSFCFNCLFAV